MRLQTVEIQILGVLIAIPTLIVLMFINMLNVYTFIILIASVLIVTIVIPLYILLYSFVLSKKYETKSIYNPFFRVIELHVGANKKELTLKEIVENTIDDASKLNVDIVFCTNHFEKKVLERWSSSNPNVALEIKKANMFQYLCYYVGYSSVIIKVKPHRRPKRKYPLLSCIIRVER